MYYVLAAVWGIPSFFLPVAVALRVLSQESVGELMKAHAVSL